MAALLAALGWAMANAKKRLGSPSAPPAEGDQAREHADEEAACLKRNGEKGDDADFYCLQSYLDACFVCIVLDLLQGPALQFAFLIQQQSRESNSALLHMLTAECLDAGEATVRRSAAAVWAATLALVCSQQALVRCSLALQALQWTTFCAAAPPSVTRDSPQVGLTARPAPAEPLLVASADFAWPEIQRPSPAAVHSLTPSSFSVSIAFLCISIAIISSTVNRLHPHRSSAPECLFHHVVADCLYPFGPSHRYRPSNFPPPVQGLPSLLPSLVCRPFARPEVVDGPPLAFSP
ncbi:hypothetical protein TASIC1_0006033000 [Trichoderma asperellum]|uniref:Uncharacterized protein n=1 Tax=Trichoderma asperellum TaxID=101201 RepID=A0A6V8QUW7_TRIAP|nr:hypothetical protein TASIC1_0006033000 [Trichoderma asperellum]